MKIKNSGGFMKVNKKILKEKTIEVLGCDNGQASKIVDEIIKQTDAYNLDSFSKMMEFYNNFPKILKIVQDQLIEKQKEEKEEEFPKYPECCVGETNAENILCIRDEKDEIIPIKEFITFSDKDALSVFEIAKQIAKEKGYSQIIFDDCTLEITLNEKEQPKTEKKIQYVVLARVVDPNLGEFPPEFVMQEFLDKLKNPPSEGFQPGVYSIEMESTGNQYLDPFKQAEEMIKNGANVVAIPTSFIQESK